MTSDVQPLDAFEEDELRRMHVACDRTVEFTWVKTGERGSQVESDCLAGGDDEKPWPCDIARLLATLDAERVRIKR